ncbi:bifunctional 2-C-methyl-D-erythritol 4-phosphate cytidylyltransferase/2-C-methyl-D-erythritol 2,4-cyclodiphosphate synthase [Amaricoccus tamworthensis]|uniref:bifunctional 2-C-methyl-D-erythritol 4-phosphate cytidylyltransferase/2-C-methyl-D-erythritol 2,4-cyclodiphosphate synthase n=1 Tax=Amaricoccus tamworthensis TaxID=57002 RepID=UPI003C7A612A
METVGLIVAAGRGSRMGGDTPKQYLDLNGQPILRHTITAFLSSPVIDAVIVVIHPEDAERYAQATQGLNDNRLLPLVHGGQHRAASVLEGLKALEARNPQYVLIHDAARPFVTLDIIRDVRESLNTGKGAFPALRVIDALWKSDGDHATTPQDRTGLWRAQTPQGFHFREILSAHENSSGDLADDVAVARAKGIDVRIVSGSESNYKITTAADYGRAQHEIGSNTMDVRCGNGYDVHAFTEGDSVVLCGISIPHDQALKGHSDADVAMHAVTDALFGAIAEGDIGQWFPPSDPKWKGAASEVFLVKSAERVKARGFEISSIDCTIICERPKIGPHSDPMRAELARILGIDVGRVSVKATTSEKLGFTGRGEGIAAMATATVVSQ